MLSARQLQGGGSGAGEAQAKGGGRGTGDDEQGDRAVADHATALCIELTQGAEAQGAEAQGASSRVSGCSALFM